MDLVKGTVKHYAREQAKKATKEGIRHVQRGTENVLNRTERQVVDAIDNYEGGKRKRKTRRKQRKK